MGRHSIFILEDVDHVYYDNLYKEYHMLVPLIYEPKQLTNVAKSFLKDLFFIVNKPAQQLIVYPELSLFFRIAQYFLKR